MPAPRAANATATSAASTDKDPFFSDKTMIQWECEERLSPPPKNEQVEAPPDSEGLSVEEEMPWFDAFYDAKLCPNTERVTFWDPRIHPRQSLSGLARPTPIAAALSQEI